MDHQPPPKNLQDGKGITLPSIQEKDRQIGSSSNQSIVTDDHDGSSCTTAIHVRDDDHVGILQNDRKEDEVDTTLSIMMPSSGKSQLDTTLSLRPHQDSSSGKSRKRKAANVDVVAARKRGFFLDDEDEWPLVPIEEVQGLFQAVQSRRGTNTPPPTFLYRTVLQSDSDLNTKLKDMMLYVFRNVREMGFFRKEEVEAVDGAGAEMMGVDGRGNVYDKLVWKRWCAELEYATGISCDWKKVAAANYANHEDICEIWGFRDFQNKPCLAFHFC